MIEGESAAMYKTILAPTDGSEFSDAALREAGALAKTLGAKVILFHAIPHYHAAPLTEGLSAAGYFQEIEHAQEEQKAEGEQILTSAARNVNLVGVEVERDSAVSNSPYEAIIEAANRYSCDLIVMASHGRRGLSGLLLGSETQKVLTHSRIPVLVVR